MKRKIILFFVKILSILLLISLMFFGGLYFYYSRTIPSIDDILNINQKQTVDILYSNNIDKIKSYNSSRFDIIPYSSIPNDLINALIATEDRKFFSHKGVDYFGIIRAIIVDLRHKHLRQGGSTISQQLAKAILNDNSKTFRRKFKELILTKKIEKVLTKENILSIYLSSSYFGAGQHGIKDASKFYFDKELNELKLEECAMLVGLLKAPSKYNPTNDEDLTQSRTKQVIINMENAGFIDKNDIFSYIIPDLDFSKGNFKRNGGSGSQNYFFSDWVYNQVKDMYFDVGTRKITVLTTLDYGIQNVVVNVVDNFIEKNKKKIDKSELAVVVMNKKGEVLSMVGGKNYAESQFNRSLYAYRQTGSLFKLFIYLTGFENGLKINDVFIDEPIKVANWYPENYNSKYYGKLTVKEAFALSSNSVAVQIADYFGIDKVVKMANKLGIVNDFKNDLTIALGSQESNLLDMTSVYTMVANGGIPVFPYSIKHIVVDGNVVYRRSVSEKRSMLKKDTVENMQYLLFSVVNEGTGKNARIESLVEKTKAYNMMNRDNKFFIGGKTGSTQNNKDAWFIGFANDFVVGVWFGNDDNTPTNKIMGGNLPAMLWKEIVEGIVF
ncbi:MAG: transglycosylase domain-containing protein [Rickettsiales bacterium]|nr:transglycosylase domain-containing protein [Rickettsiales bacterium]